MPIFEFWCEKCGQEFEEITSSAESSPPCPHCGATTTRKLMSACARHKRGNNGGGDFSAPASGGGCAGCSGGNCSSCGH